MIVTIPADRRERIAALAYDYAGQPKEALAACNLCGGATFVVITHQDRYGFPAQAHACSTCGLVFLNPRLTVEAYTKFYEAVYRPLVSAYHGRLIDAHTIQAEQRDYASDRAECLRPFMSPRMKTLLDIGGSTGVVAAHIAKEFGLTGTLIDPAPLEVAEARRFGLGTITGFVEQHDFKGQAFDLVLICQTVDHLLDIAGTLQRVRALLTDRGRLFIDIVDFRAAYLRNRSVEGAVKIDHPYYLTESTMTAYLRGAGCEVLRSDYAADHLHISYVCEPARPDPDALPDNRDVAAMLREIRSIQNDAATPNHESSITNHQ
jgi:hypothetical protein